MLMVSWISTLSIIVFLARVERLVSEQRRAMEPASVALVVVPDTVHGAGVVPDDEVVDRPLVHVDELRLGCPLQQAAEELVALVVAHADHRPGAVAQDERVAARAVVPD